MFTFDLAENEKLLNFYRQTETLLVKPVLTVFALIYTPWYFLLKYELAAEYRWLLLFWTGLVFLYAVGKYLMWLLTVYLVTTERLVSVTYRTLFHKEVREVPIDRITGISYRTTGFFSSLFGYGDVDVNIQNTANILTLKNIRKPGAVKDFLWKVQKDSPDHRQDDVAEAIKMEENHLKIKAFEQNNSTDDGWLNKIGQEQEGKRISRPKQAPTQTVVQVPAADAQAKKKKIV